MRNQIVQDTLWRRRAAILLFFCLSPSFAAAAAHAAERWYIVSISGQPVGSIEEAVSTDAAESRTENRMRLVLNRLGTRVEMAAGWTTRESADGRLRSAATDLKLSSQSTSTTAEVGEGLVRIRSQAGGQSFEREVPFSGELLGPQGIRLLTQARLRSPGDSLETQTFAAELGSVAVVKRRLLSRETIASEGREIPALRIEEEISGYPGKRTLWLDGAGLLLASEETGPFGPMRVFRADAATARRAGESGGELPAEVYAGTIVRTQIRLPQPRRIEWLKLRLLHRNPDLGWPDLDRPGQKVVEKTDRSLIVEVSRSLPVPGLPFPVPATEVNQEYLAPNSYLQSNDPELRAKALEIVGDEKDLFRAALRLERWVAENMRFDLGIAMASSAEVFKNRRGTCVGYATLLTTLARAAGIPARLVMGYVYVDGMFGGHAWTEIMAGDQWLPLDAAIVAPDTADAARFALVASSLREGPGLLTSGPALQLFGQIDARVLGYAVEGGERVAVAADAKPYAVAGDVYRNPGLGIELRKPAGFRFTDLDDTWPESTLVRIVGADGDKVALESRRRWPWEEAEAASSKLLATEVSGGRPGRLEVAGHAAWKIEGEGQAAVAIPGPEVIWLLRAEGPRAAALVRQVAAGLRL